MSRFTQSGGVDLRQGRGDQRDQGYQKVPVAVIQSEGDVTRLSVVGEEGRDQGLAEGDQHRRADGEKGEDGVELEAEGVADTLVVALAEELGGEDARPREATKNGQIADEHELVGDARAGEFLGGELAYHDVVQKIDKIGDAVLYDDGDGEHQHHLVKGLVAYEFFDLHV